MLKKQMEQIGSMAGQQGLVNQNERMASVLLENERKQKEFDEYLKNYLKKE
jgi:hypothetical protein